MPFIEINERGRQTAVLLKKNFLLNIRSAKSTALQLLVPVIFIVLLYVFQLAQVEGNKASKFIRDTPRQEQQNITTIPRCKAGFEGPGYCYSFAYYPQTDANVRLLVETIREMNSIPEEEVIGFDAEADANLFIMDHPNTTQGLYVVEFDYGCAFSDSCAAERNRTVDQVQGVRYYVHLTSRSPSTASITSTPSSPSAFP